MASRRIERCYTDNIYLIESLPPDPEDDTERIFVIMGHSGNVYNVTISNRPHCSCPDFYLRGNRCKHIFFVLMRIMNVSDYTDNYYTDDELTEMFSNIPPVARDLMYKGRYKGSQVLSEGKEVEQKFETGDICPICLDPLENGKDLDFCRFSCGKTIHKKCFSMWEKSKGSICVFCRANWYSNLPVKIHRKVAMHPSELNDINNNIQNNEEDNEMDLDKEDKEEESESDNKKEKKRKKNRSRSRNKSRSRSRNKSKSRSRSRDKRKNKKKKKNYIYPKD